MSPACVGFFRVSDGRYHRMRTEFLVHDVSADTRPSDADLTLRRHLWEKSRLRGARGSSSGVCSSHEASSVSQHGSRTWLLSAAEGHAKRRYDLSRPTFFFEFFRMTIKVTEFVQFLNSIVLQCFEAADERSTTPCASAVAPTPRDRSAQGCQSLCRWCRPFSMALRPGLSLLAVDDVHWVPIRLLKVAIGSESSGTNS